MSTGVHSTLGDSEIWSVGGVVGTNSANGDSELTVPQMTLLAASQDVTVTTSHRPVAES